MRRPTQQQTLDDVVAEQMRSSWWAHRHTWAVTTVTSLRVVAATGCSRQDLLLPLEPCVAGVYIGGRIN